DAPVAVVVTRDPLEVAQSVHARSGFPVHAGLALWELYLERSLAATADVPRLHVRYEDVVADPVAETRRLVGALGDLGVAGLQVPDEGAVLDFVSPSLRRQRAGSPREERLNPRQLELAAAADD